MSVRFMWAAVLALALLAAPPAADAQPAGKTWRIGLLNLSSPSTTAPGLDALRAVLREAGYVEGRSFTIEERSAEGRAERLPELAAQLVARKVDVIVTGGGNVSALAARKATGTIPIVMSASAGAVEAGLVESLARPGGNVTGLSVPRELGAKQLELLRELNPQLSRVVILLRGDFTSEERRAQSRARALELLRLTIDYVDVREPEDLPRAFAAVRALRPGAMIVGPDALFLHEQDRIIGFARTTRLPAIYPFRVFVDAGGLMSYSISSAEAYRGAGRYLDRIFKGAKPADLPVEQPTRLELVINRKTAQSIGLTIPPALLLRADDVIE